MLAGRRLGGGRRVGWIEGSGATHRAQSTPRADRATGGGRRSPCVPGAQRPPRAMNQVVASNRMYIVTPSTNGLTRSPPGVTTVAKTAIPRIT